MDTGDIALVVIGGYVAHKLFNRTSAVVPDVAGIGNAYSNLLGTGSGDVHPVDAAVRRSGGRRYSTRADDRDNGPVVAGYNEYVNSKPVLSVATIRSGNVLNAGIGAATGVNPTIKAATEGVSFARDLGSDRARYDNLGNVSKALVTGGEAISRTFVGVSPYNAGKRFSSWLNRNR